MQSYYGWYCKIIVCKKAAKKNKRSFWDWPFHKKINFTFISADCSVVGFTAGVVARRHNLDIIKSKLSRWKETTINGWSFSLEAFITSLSDCIVNCNFSCEDRDGRPLGFCRRRSIVDHFFFFFFATGRQWKNDNFVF